MSFLGKISEKIFFKFQADYVFDFYWNPAAVICTSEDLEVFNRLLVYILKTSHRNICIVVFVRCISPSLLIYFFPIGESNRALEE